MHCPLFLLNYCLTGTVLFYKLSVSEFWETVLENAGYYFSKTFPVRLEGQLAVQQRGHLTVQMKMFRLGYLNQV